jgi:hypothetical protein
MGMGTDWPLDFSRTTGTGKHGGVDSAVGVRTSGNVEAVLEAVHGGDLALASLVGAAHDRYLVLRKVSTPGSGGEGSDVRLCGRECCAHHAARGAPYSVAPEDVRTCRARILRLHTLMMTRRTLLGALKCAFRDLRRELASCVWTLAIVAVVSTVGLGEEVRRRARNSCSTRLCTALG